MAGKSKAKTKVKSKSARRSPAVKRDSWGQQIAARLKRFADEVESLSPDAPLSARFTVRTVKVDLSAPICTADEVKAAREILGASQTIFAQFLGVSPSAVQDWEQGHKPPSGSACRLMHEVRRDPNYWRKRLLDLVERS